MFTILVAVSLLRKISYLHPNTKWRVLDGRVLRSIKMCQDNQYRSDLKANIIKSLSQNAVFAISRLLSINICKMRLSFFELKLEPFFQKKVLPKVQQIEN